MTQARAAMAAATSPFSVRHGEFHGDAYEYSQRVLNANEYSERRRPGSLPVKRYLRRQLAAVGKEKVRFLLRELPGTRQRSPSRHKSTTRHFCVSTDRDAA
jgi:hypothetical protein